MIAKTVDSITDGVIGPGDTIKMGQYPTSPNVIKPAQLRSQFEDWRVKSHTIVTVPTLSPTAVHVTTTGGDHVWQMLAYLDEYIEWNGGAMSDIIDSTGVGESDLLLTQLTSPSQPTSGLHLDGPGLGDDGFLEVEIYP